MGRKAGGRAASDVGLTTGAATTVLALLSAGAVASISLVGAHQLAPAISERLRASAPSVVHAPETVVVTPRTTPTPSAPGGATHPAKPKSRTTSPPDVVVERVDIAAPVAQRGGGPAVPGVGPGPTLEPPTVDPDPPALPTPTLSPLDPRDPSDPKHPPRRDKARHDDDDATHHHGRDHRGRNQHGRHHNDRDADRERGHGHDSEYGDDHRDRHADGRRGSGRHHGGGSGDDDRNGRHHGDGRNQGDGRNHGGGHDDSHHDRRSR